MTHTLQKNANTLPRAELAATLSFEIPSISLPPLPLPIFAVRVASTILTGRDRHMALTIKSLGPLKDALQQAKLPFTMSKSERAELFCRDPDGNAFEFLETPDLV